MTVRSVLRDGKAPLLQNFVVRPFKNRRSVFHILPPGGKSLLPTSGKCIESQRLRCLPFQGQGVARLKSSLCKEHRPAAKLSGIAGQSGGVRRIYGCGNRIKMQFLQLRFIPGSPAAFHLRQLRVNIGLKVVPIGKSKLFDDFFLRYKGNGKGLHTVGDLLVSLHGQIGDRIRLSSVAAGINACQRIRNEAVFQKTAAVAAGNGAGKLGVPGNIYQRHASGNKAAASQHICGNAVANDAAYIFTAFQCAFCIAVLHRASGDAGNAAHIISAFALCVAISHAAGDHAQIHTAADAACIIPFGGNFSSVGAFLQYGFKLIGAAPHFGELRRNIIFGVQFIFQCHASGNAAGVDIPLHGTIVSAKSDLSVGNGVNIHTGGIFEYIFQRLILHAQQSIKSRVANEIYLLVDLAQILTHGAGKTVQLAVEQPHLAGHAGNGGGKPSQ